MFKSILVLESPWGARSVESKSVWPFVSEFAKAMDLSAFHQVFQDKASFCHWIEVFNGESVQKPKLLYVAAHGTEGRIKALRKKINGQTVVSALQKAKKIRYVHFGSCLFGNDSNLSLLLGRARHIRWAAGYENVVDWVDSTLFDIMLWRRICIRDWTTKGIKSHTLAQELVSETAGLARNLGFRFQYRYRKNLWSLSAKEASLDS